MGYVTLITEGNRSVSLWQEVFDKMRRLHIIPIIRYSKEENEIGNHYLVKLTAGFFQFVKLGR